MEQNCYVVRNVEKVVCGISKQLVDWMYAGGFGNATKPQQARECWWVTYVNQNTRNPDM